MVYDYGCIQGNILPMEGERSGKNVSGTTWESRDQETAYTYSVGNCNIATDVGAVSWLYASQDEDVGERRESSIKMSSIRLAMEGHFAGTEYS